MARTLFAKILLWSVSAQLVTFGTSGHRGTALDGSTVQLSDLRGRWVVLNFFQSTCLPCKAEHPELVSFAAQQAGIEAGEDSDNQSEIDHRIETVHGRQFLACLEGPAWSRNRVCDPENRLYQ